LLHSNKLQAKKAFSASMKATGVRAGPMGCWAAARCQDPISYVGRGYWLVAVINILRYYYEINFQVKAIKV
jgi:hypothetical protein